MYVGVSRLQLPLYQIIAIEVEEKANQGMKKKGKRCLLSVDFLTTENDTPRLHKKSGTARHSTHRMTLNVNWRA